MGYILWGWGEQLRRSAPARSINGPHPADLAELSPQDRARRRRQAQLRKQDGLTPAFRVFGDMGHELEAMLAEQRRALCFAQACMVERFTTIAADSLTFRTVLLLGDAHMQALPISILGNAVAEGPVLLLYLDQVDHDVLTP